MRATIRAGLIGILALFGGSCSPKLRSLPGELPILVAAVAAGALVGTWLGAGRLPKPRLLQGLGLVLVIAGTKLIFA